MLAFDPDERISVPEALKHPWLSSYHDESDEPDCPQIFDRWREIEQLETLDDFREALWNEIENYRREVRGLKLISLDRTLSTSPVKASESMVPVSREEERGVSEPEIITEDSTEVETTSTPVEDDSGTTKVALVDIGAEEEAKLQHKAGDRMACHPTVPSDPVVMYARRSSIFLPSRQNSTYNSPVRPTQYLPTFVENQAQSEIGSIAFPTQGYVYPARSRTGSTVGGEVTRKLLRTLSTVSIHESVEGLAGGLAGISKFIVDGRTEADAPPSEMPKDFSISPGLEKTDNSEERKTEGQSRKGCKFSLE